MDKRKTVTLLAAAVGQDKTWVRVALAQLNVSMCKGSDEYYSSDDPILESRVRVLCSDMHQTYPKFPEPCLRANWGDIARDQIAWSKYNFGDSPNHQPLLGIIEECGELTEAMAVNHPTEIEDAVGDICIYIIDYAGRIGAVHANEMATFFRQSDHIRLTVDGFDLLTIVGRLAHTHLKAEQNIRGKTLKDTSPILRDIIQAVMLLTNLTNEDLLRITHETWTKVAHRDWVRYPGKGRPTPETP